MQHITTPSDAGVLSIAEALLQAGLLQEADWNPALGLVGSMQEGVTAWLKEQGFTPLQYFSIEWAFTDDIGLWGLSNSEWQQVDEDPATGNVGGFALLMHDSIDTPTLRESIRSLEALAKGAGFSVLHALYRGLHATVGAWTPAVAADWMETDWDERELEPDMYGEVLTKDEFHATLPIEALDPEWKPRAVYRAKKQILGRDGTAVIFYLAEEIREALETWKQASKVTSLRYLNDINDFGMEQMYPIVLRWSEDDSVMRVFDDWQEMILNCGEYTHGLFLRCFHVNRAEQIQEAITHMIQATRILSLCNHLLGYLDSRKELVHIFNQAEVQTQVEERVRVTV